MMSSTGMGVGGRESFQFFCRSRSSGVRKKLLYSSSNSPTISPK